MRDSAAYNIPRAFRLRGELHAGALARAFAGLAARHEILRTTFPAADGGPVQAVSPPGPVPLPQAGELLRQAEDLRQRSKAETAAEGAGSTANAPPAAEPAPQGLPPPKQWFGGVLSNRAGSIALMDGSGAVVVDAIVYGSQQSSSSANGYITSPEIATLEAEQGRGGCIAVVPPAGGRGAGPVTTANRSLGRYPDGFDADNLCTDFMLQPATTLSAAALAGATNIKVASVADFVAGEVIGVDAGANLETVMVVNVGTAGASTMSGATNAGTTVIPVANAGGFVHWEAVSPRADRGERERSQRVLRRQLE